MKLLHEGLGRSDDDARITRHHHESKRTEDIKATSLHLLASIAMQFLSVLVALVSAAVLVSASPDEVCDGQVVLSETFIGEEKNVKVQHLTCPVAATKTKRALAPRQTNVCGNNCQTSCFTPAGGGPNPNDCHIIADALRFDSQNIGPFFNITAGVNNTVALTFASCLSFYVNQDTINQTYCRTDWAGVIDFIAPNCQATQNAHGGLCVETNQNFFIQVNAASVS
ncbi:hypothetical protein GYMLUDRAFT_40307 [Collybiopsis luxurians FD-317 M1]|uniref:Uncharacterized protein n=1 Tax=Collybiopsis luxurians FD-317 M1 TaxID=944289 RepID=A0A0D0CWB1_9AGAR|nr:hypothetical protein GYMLUDRAFT_40307 [Collybiopsis luxurians FD-317 M1]